MLGVRHGECLSPFLFAIYLKDLKVEFILKGSDGIDIGMLKIFLFFFEYYQRYKLSVNTLRTTVMVFTKGILPRDLKFYYNGKEINIVNTFSYLGVVFSTSGSFSNCQKTLSGQAQKAIFKLNRYLYTFTNITQKAQTRTV